VSSANITTVQHVYEAFGQGDIDAILAVVSDDVDWASEAEPAVAPWHGVHKGKGEVPKFFEALAKHVEVTRFEPLTFAANDDDVLAVVRFAMAVPATGKRGEMDLHHWFHFRDGKIARYRGTEDTALTQALLTP
jgi:ketosteroid isomerase-like protein